jgi:hypothetical protein
MGGAEPAGYYTSYFCSNGNKNHELRTGLFIHKGIKSADEREEYRWSVVCSTS